MSELSYRPSLDGLRCVAVCSVLVYHLDRGWLPGGFLGVDVFFALSGYLITTLLVMERERSGRISIPGFWSRRARRLLPASVVLISVVALWLRTQPEFIQAARRGDLLSALANVANWHLISTGQSYFQAFATASPVRHFWSLAIEEQFYLVWPLTCAILLRSNRLRSLVTLCAVGAVMSTVLCAVLFVPSDPSRSYYGTDTRVHQLLIGALLACWFAHRRRAQRPTNAKAAALPGLIALVAGIVLVHDQWSGYYRGGSLAIAIVTVFVIAGLESAPDGKVARIIGTPIAAAIGRGSYGLYLWHWPIYVWLAPGTWGLNAGWPISLARLAVTGVVAFVSYRFIEQPIRNPKVRSLRRPRLVAAGSLSGIVVAASLTVTMTWGAKLPVWAGGKQPDRVSGDLGSIRVGVPRIAVLGDSVAASMVPGLRAETDAKRWQLFDASEPGCPITMLPQLLDDGTTHPQNPVCAGTVPALQRQALAFAPDVVIWHDLQSTLSLEVASGLPAPAGSEHWKELNLHAWQGVLDSFRKGGARVLVVMPPLRSQDPAGGCGPTVRCQDIQAQDDRIRTLTAEFLKRNSGDPGVSKLDLDPLLCPKALPCPGTIEGIEVRIAGWDQTHFTEPGARWIAPKVIAEVSRVLPVVNP